MRKIGVGVIGWGFMGKTHTHALREMPLFYPEAGFQPVLASVCSRRIDKAREAAESMGFGHFTDDFRETLARTDVEVVSICTPNAMHEEMAVAALRAGKHVYIDKPLSVDAASAARIAIAAEASGRITQMALNNRFFPATMRAKQLIEEGRIGEVLSFSCRYLHSGSVDPDKPVGWKMLSDAGVTQDLGSHALDLMGWLIGYPKEVFCARRVLYPERPAPGGGTARELGDDQALMLWKLPNGAMGTIEASKIATGAEDELDFAIYGSKGAVRWQPMRQGELEFLSLAAPDAPLGGERGFTHIATGARYEAPGGTFLPPKNALGWDRGHIHSYYHFLNCVARGVPAEPSIAEGARLQALMDRLALSDREGRWVEI